MNPSSHHSIHPLPRLLPHLLLVVILLTAALLRFFALDSSSLWSDEGNTWALVHRSFAAIARDAAADIHPPGYYWLLKLWSQIWGTDAYALRAFSALCGVLLVGATYWITRQCAGHTHTNTLPLQVTALLAASLVALNPLQIYYSQEARMYMPLALVGAGLYAAIIAYTRREACEESLRAPALGFVICATLGLWLHYSFPILLIGAGGYYLIHWYRVHWQTRNWRVLIRFGALALLAVAAFLPWLPTALGQILHWPQGNIATGPLEGLRLTLDTLLFGPVDLRPTPLAPWLWGAAILPLLGLWTLAQVDRGPSAPDPTRDPRPSQEAGVMPALALWLLLPIVMMFALGLFSDAFLKFLLAASPAWAIAVAWAIYTLSATIRRGQAVLFPRTTWEKAGLIAMGLLVMGAATGLAVWTVPSYYTDPTARDNYAGIAHYVAAHSGLSTPDHSPRPTLVVLNAPGQRDVWAYYDPGVPVLALPTTRPPDRDATEAALAAAIAGVERVFGVYWATDESDPEGIVEQWLADHAFPGLASWQGNVRLVDYSIPANLVCAPFATPIEFRTPDDVGALIVTGVERCIETPEATALPETETRPEPTDSMLDESPADESPVNENAADENAIDENLSVAAGDVLLLGLGWTFETTFPPEPELDPELALDNLAVSLQVLDSRNQVIAQRDAPLPPAESGITFDNHGIPIPIGTPPGPYRLILAVYDPASGVRLTTDAGTTGTLGTVQMTRPADQTAALIDAMHLTHQPLGPVTLLGYDLHRRDFSHAPETSIHPGDPVQFTFYWQAPPSLPVEWPADLHFELQLGEARLQAPLAGGDYATAHWQPNEIVRARFELPFDGQTRRPQLHIGRDSLQLQPLP